MNKRAAVFLSVKYFLACAALLAAMAFFVPAPAAFAVEAATVRVLMSFEDGRSPFSGRGEVVREHATHGAMALRMDGGYIAHEGPQDWTGFDYLKADLYNASSDPVAFSVEIRDDKTRDYWTRVNYETIIPPGSSTLVLSTSIYVGEKSRPGRPLDKSKVVRLVFSIPDEPAAPVYIDNIRVERDDAAAKVAFEGLMAFDFGTETSPLMDGFTRVTPSTLYGGERGYGLRNARVWRAFDLLQPEPLYQDCITIEAGGFSADVPNGRYRVFLNIDSASGYWGEYQKYRERRVIAEGAVVVRDTMDYDSFNSRYYRFWNVEDLPSDNTFDKYQEAYFDEKTFEVEVSDGRLDLEFEGETWAASVSAVVIYPVAKAAEGEAFLAFVKERRRFHFDNYFRRVLHKGTGESFAATAAEIARGFVLFSRHYMDEVYYNDRPEPGERAAMLRGAAFAGEYEPVTLSVLPLRYLGAGRVSVSDLRSGDARIPSSAVDVGNVSYRLSRVTMEGTVYTIEPRLVMPESSVAMPADIARRFWLTVKVPADAAPGLYRGEVVFESASVRAAVPLEFTVRPGTLDALDIPAGPWGHTIDTPWFGNDPRAREHNERMARKSLAKLREYGFTSFSGAPSMAYRGFRDGVAQFDFAAGDAQMKRAREAGFSMPITNYTHVGGLDLYYQDEAAMKAAGFTDYSAFVRAVFSAVQKHADAAGWLPVYWNLGDEPVGDNIRRSTENARAYTKAFPSGPPYFTAATSFRDDDPEEPHFVLASALHVANVNLHNEAAINLLRERGGGWAFYNGGSRWTFGLYMYKAAKEFDMKFRLSWHWNVVAGDPYYALDCREDDYAWCNSSPDGTLIASLVFERHREGVDDYRRVLTLDRLAREKAGTSEAAAAEALIARWLGAFRLGQRDHDALFGKEGWDRFRGEFDEAITSLRK